MPTTIGRRRRLAVKRGKRKARKMPNPVQQLSLIDDIDARQNEVLDQLDELNLRVEQVLQECAPKGPATSEDEASF